MRLPAHHVSSASQHEYLSRSVDDCRRTTGSCQHEQQLRDIEAYLTDVLIAARQSVERCEQALALVAAVRQHAIVSEPVYSTRPPTIPQAESALERVLKTAPLTERESEVLRLIATGNSNREIAETLFLSPRTVERHIANIYLKIHAHNKAEAVAYARSDGLA